MWHVSGLAFHTGVTAAEVLVGFILGSLLGAFIGYLIGMSPTAEFALSPYILALQIAPKVAFAPLFILWMGFHGLSENPGRHPDRVLSGDGQCADRRSAPSIPT
jgi:ABC-type nitrate/sulfonate/bicarbonate transport system permease component